MMTDIKMHSNCSALRVSNYALVITLFLILRIKYSVNEARKLSCNVKTFKKESVS